MSVVNEVFRALQGQPERHLSEKAVELLKQVKLAGLIPKAAKEDFKAQWLLNQLYIQEIQSWNIPPHLFEKATLLKGFHLITSGIYEHMAMRFMGDVDLLVNAQDLMKWEEFFIERGYEDITMETWEANSFKKIYLKRFHGLELVIELHTRLFYQEEPSHQWEKRQHSNLPGFLVLKDEDLYVHLCGHLAYQHTFISLHWLYDILILTSKVELNWTEIAQKAKRSNVLKSCQLINTLLMTYFHQHNIDNLGISYLAKKVCIQFLTPSFLCYPSERKWRYWFVKHFTKDHLFQSLVYDLLWMKTKIRACFN